jgi:hypothetical protein
MKNPLHRFLLLLLLAMLLQVPVGHCFAQTEDTAIVAPLTVDTSEEAYEEDYEDEVEETESSGTNIVPYIRTIPADTMAAFKRNSSFTYIAYLDSMLRDEQRKRDSAPKQQQEEVVDEGPSIWESGFVKLLFYIVAFGLVGFVLYKLFIGQGIFFRNKRQNTIPTVELEETPDESDLEKALRTAIGRKDYRLGTRYLFLMTLQHLGERGIVQLSSDKTNYQYALELSNKPYANHFAQLSLQYEYVWFGNFPVSEQQFNIIQQQHQQFLKQV